MADIDPHINIIVEINMGRLAMELPNKAASTARTVRAGNPNNNCDNASPVMYVRGDTGAATNRS
jgi:hypothetical protein